MAFFYARRKGGAAGMYFTNGKKRAFELLMQQKPGFDRFQSGCTGSDEDCCTCYLLHIPLERRYLLRVPLSLTQKKIALQSAMQRDYSSVLSTSVISFAVAVIIRIPVSLIPFSS